MSRRRSATFAAPLSIVLATGAAISACSDNAVAVSGLGFADDCNLPSANIALGQNRDAIPALTVPLVANGASADFMLPDDRVLGIFVDGEARAYPLFILWWHEVINDVLGETPVAVTYCPLTGSGLTFHSETEGVTLEFGVSGLVFENNLMMFDRETESLWPQLLQQARCGPASGSSLEQILTVETTWAEWLDRYPQTSVVTPSTGFTRNYGSYPYGDYAFPAVGRLLFPSSAFASDRLPKERVLALSSGDDAVAFPYFTLAERGESAAINDAIGGDPIVVTFDSPSVTAMAFDAIVEGQALTFAVSDGDPRVLIDDQTGSSWNLYGEAFDGPLSGKALEPRADAYVVFWFAWSVFNPDTRLVL